MVTVVLWPDTVFPLQSVFGLPAWKRTAKSLAGRRKTRFFWMGGDSSIPTLESQSIPQPEPLHPNQWSSKIKNAPGPILVSRAGLPCLRPQTVSRLLRRASSAPTMLESGGRVLAIAAVSASQLAFKKGMTLDQVAAAMSARPMNNDDDERELVWTRSVDTLTKASQILRARRLDELIRRGVLFDDPAQVLVEPDVTIEAGTRVGPWVVLGEGTRIGKNCQIGAFNHILRSKIGDDTTILDHCYIADSRIGTSARVGPFSHLRPSTQIGAHTKVGNFVELKNVRLGSGTKASHLAYIGDAVTGRDVNIGAGVITCNYDGRRKHQTIVGDHAFIGSDVQLVAPVRIGKGAFVAAGSCIVENVPAKSLAVARSRQIVKRGWAERSASSPKRKTKS